MSEITDLQELQRRSNDTVMIHNPTNEDYRLVYNSLVHIVPNKTKDNGYGPGNLNVARYLGAHYLKHMTDSILHKRVDGAVKEENRARKEAGKPLMALHNEREEFENSIARVGDPKTRETVMKTLFKGLVKEFGVGERVEGVAHEMTPVYETVDSFMDSMVDAVAPEVVHEEVMQITDTDMDIATKKLEALAGIAE